MPKEYKNRRRKKIVVNIDGHTFNIQSLINLMSIPSSQLPMFLFDLTKLDSYA